MAAKGYPGTPKKGGAIAGLEQKGATIFQAGTARKDAASWSPTGAACSASPRAARTSPPPSAPPIAPSTGSTFPSGFCRRDIGWREIARLGRSRADARKGKG
jgi:phosphoribosylamine--glycine ligase